MATHFGREALVVAVKLVNGDGIVAPASVAGGPLRGGGRMEHALIR
jgi:hypothetical protein